MLIFLFLATACGGQRIGINASEATAVASQLAAQAGTPVIEATTPGLTGTAAIPAAGSTLTAVSTSLIVSQVAPASNTLTAGGIPVTGVGAASVICQFCVDQIPHAVVLLPQLATFSMVSDNGSPVSSGIQTACNTIEALNGQQVVLCFGETGAAIILKVCTNGSSCMQVPIKLNNCPASQPAGPNQADTPAATPSIIATSPTSGTIPASAPVP